MYSSNHYVLKVVGLDVYLLDDVPLCDYAYVQEYMKQVSVCVQ